MKRALITGISGFVGSHLAKELVSRGWEVSGLVRRSTQSGVPSRLSRLGIGSSVSLLEGDITDTLLRSPRPWGFAKPDAVFHLAAQS